MNARPMIRWTLLMMVVAALAAIVIVVPGRRRAEEAAQVVTLPQVTVVGKREAVAAQVVRLPRVIVTGRRDAIDSPWRQARDNDAGAPAAAGARGSASQVVLADSPKADVAVQ